MNTKILLISFILLYSGFAANAQEKNEKEKSNNVSDHVYGVGASYFSLVNGAAFGANFAYRSNYKTWGDNRSLSWTVTPGIGNHFDIPSKSQYIIDLPLLFCYNQGYSATSRYSKGVGFFFGLGAGAHIYQRNGLGFGPEFGAGVRGRIGSVPMELRIDFHWDLVLFTNDVTGVHLNILLNQKKAD